MTDQDQQEPTFASCSGLLLSTIGSVAWLLLLSRDFSRMARHAEHKV